MTKSLQKAGLCRNVAAAPPVVTVAGLSATPPTAHWAEEPLHERATLESAPGFAWPAPAVCPLNGRSDQSGVPPPVAE